MKQLITDDYIIKFSESLENFVEKSVEHAEKKKIEFCEIFECEREDVDKLKVTFFDNRKDFEEYIFEISGELPPSWAGGCFYGGEIQVLIKPGNENERLNTLAHETLHLFFNKTIYEKHNIDRVVWLDESFAMFLDGEPNDFSEDELTKVVQNLSKISNFDMNITQDWQKIKTDTYNAYDMFDVIGKYIFETKQEKKFLNLLKQDRNKIVEIGTHILNDAIGYLQN